MRPNTRPVSHEHVGGAGIRSARGMIGTFRSHDDGVAIDRHGEPKIVAHDPVVRSELLGLTPNTVRFSREHVGGFGCSAGTTTHHHSVAGHRHGASHEVVGPAGDQFRHFFDILRRSHVPKATKRGDQAKHHHEQLAPLATKTHRQPLHRHSVLLCISRCRDGCESDGIRSAPFASIRNCSRSIRNCSPA